jgi:hypothetical protein
MYCSNGAWMCAAGSGSISRRLCAAQVRFERIRRNIRRSLPALVEDWHGARYFSYGLVLLLLTSAIVAAYYINHPQPETGPDTPSYLTVTQHILTNGNMVDASRTPGYPLLIALIFLLFGQGNLMAVSAAQGVLFVFAALEIYIITCLVFRRSWIALIVGLAVGCNIYLLSFIKPILSEGISLWVVTSLALATVLFIRFPQARFLWLVAALTLLTFMTRSEWMFLPVLLFAYLLWIAARRGVFRHLLPHALVAVLLLYGVLGLYIYENATVNHYPGVTEVQRINLLGKVLQYHMQDEAPPQYASIARAADTYLEAGGLSPYAFAEQHPALGLSANHWALAGDYANAIVEQHPVEFLLKTIPVVFTSSDSYYPSSQINLQGPLALPLFGLQKLSAGAYYWYRFFPFLAFLWFGLLFWRRTARSRAVEMMSAVALLALYDLVITSLGGYSSYARFHIVFDPLMMVVVLGSALLAGALLLPVLLRKTQNIPVLARLWPVIGWALGGALVGGVVASAAATVIRHGLAPLVHPATWTGLHLLFDHPLRTILVLGASILLCVLAWNAHRHAGSKTGKQMSDYHMEAGYAESGEMPESHLAG